MSVNIALRAAIIVSAKVDSDWRDGWKREPRSSSNSFYFLNQIFCAVILIILPVRSKMPLNDSVQQNNLNIRVS